MGHILVFSISTSRSSRHPSSWPSVSASTSSSSTFSWSLYSYSTWLDVAWFGWFLWFTILFRGTLSWSCSCFYSIPTWFRTIRPWLPWIWTTCKFLTMSTEFDKKTLQNEAITPLITKITLKFFLNIFLWSY